MGHIVYFAAVPSKAYAGMTWLDHVSGCACCLTRTRGVSPCYLAAKGCQDNATLSDCCYASGLPAERNKASPALRCTAGPVLQDCWCCPLRLSTCVQFACAPVFIPRHSHKSTGGCIYAQILL